MVYFKKNKTQKNNREFLSDKKKEYWNLDIKIMEMEVDNAPGNKSLLMRKKEIEQPKNKQPSS